MKATVSSRTGRKLEVNNADPIALLPHEAWDHLRMNRFVAFVSKPWSQFAALLVAGLCSWCAPAAAMCIVAGLVSAHMLVLCGYMWWHCGFVHVNRSRATRCPNCTSRMWQFSCARCHEPVPPLAHWLNGLFLKHCPHCGLRLSVRQGGLLAWCSTCSNSYEHADELYGKPTHVIVRISTEIPGVAEGWNPVQLDEGPGNIYHHPDDEHCACFVCFATDDRPDLPPVFEHLIGQTRFLLIDKKVPEQKAAVIRGHFGSKTLYNGP